MLKNQMEILPPLPIHPHSKKKFLKLPLHVQKAVKIESSMLYAYVYVRNTRWRINGLKDDC